MEFEGVLNALVSSPLPFFLLVVMWFAWLVIKYAWQVINWSREDMKQHNAAIREIAESSANALSQNAAAINALAQEIRRSGRGD